MNRTKICAIAFFLILTGGLYLLYRPLKNKINVILRNNENIMKSLINTQVSLIQKLDGCEKDIIKNYSCIIDKIERSKRNGLCSNS